MSTSVRWFLVAVGCCVFFSSCGPKGPPQKETFPVKGTVSVDGQPAGTLAVYCNNVVGMDTKMPTVSQTFTKDDGSFEISTYGQSDGVPEGEYTLTFMWGKPDKLHGGYGGPDKLNGRYKDPKASKSRFKVEKGKPVDLGKIELTTK